MSRAIPVAASSATHRSVTNMNRAGARNGSSSGPSNQPWTGVCGPRATSSVSVARSSHSGRRSRPPTPWWWEPKFGRYGRIRYDLRADFGALLEHTDARLSASGCSELRETTGGRKPGWARTDDDDVELEDLSLHGKTCRGWEWHCNIADRFTLA